MVKALRSGLTELVMKGTTLRGRSKGKDISNSQMEQSTVGASRTTQFMVKVSTNGLTDAHTTDNGN